VYSQLVDAIAHAPSIARIAETNSGEALAYTVSACSISKPTEPLYKRLAAVRAGVDANLPLDRHFGNVA
jgi:hypothetical protein